MTDAGLNPMSSFIIAIGSALSSDSIYRPCLRQSRPSAARALVKPLKACGATYRAFASSARSFDTLAGFFEDAKLTVILASLIGTWVQLVNTNENKTKNIF